MGVKWYGSGEGVEMGGGEGVEGEMGVLGRGRGRYGGWGGWVRWGGGMGLRMCF